MEAILTRCGMRCDLCQAYTPNQPIDPEKLQKLSDAWHKYFGFRIEPDDIRCDGCWTEGGTLLDLDCPVRPCVIEKKLQNCAECESYVCERLEKRLISREEIEERLGEKIPEEDYELAVRPFETKHRLEALRAGRGSG